MFQTRNWIVVLSLVSFLLTGQYSYGQIDTINKIDKSGLRQGFWVIKVKDIIPAQINYKSENKYEEGKYIDGKKEGIWKMYHPNGKIKFEGTYHIGVPKGLAKSYFENGCISEEGTFHNKRWIGEYKNYFYNKDTCGKIQQQVVFDSLGKRVGVGNHSKTEHFTTNEVDTILSWPHYTKKDSLRLQFCSCDSIILHGETKLTMLDVTPPHLDWKGKGNFRLYRKDKQLSKCGYFYKAELIYGFTYFYNKENRLRKLIKYYNGFSVGECEITIK